MDFADHRLPIVIEISCPRGRPMSLIQAHVQRRTSLLSSLPTEYPYVNCLKHNLVLHFGQKKIRLS